MRIFYIDGENRSPKFWCEALSQLNASDEVIVFYTDQSGKIPIRYLDAIKNCKCKLKSINVKTGTPNALDFILVSYLSQRILTAKKSEHVIVSCDSGYDIIINRFMNEGFKIMKLDAINDNTLRHLKNHLESEHISLNKENEGEYEELHNE